jgi:hypothetical protein
MPLELRKHHSKMDKAVLRAFGINEAASDSEILRELFMMSSQKVEVTLL